MMKTYKTYKTGRFEVVNDQVIDRLDDTILGRTTMVDDFTEFVPGRGMSYGETTLKAVARLMRYMNNHVYDKLLGPAPDLSEPSARKRYGIARARCHGRERYKGRISALSPQDVNQILADHAGKKMKAIEIAEKWGISRSYVYVLLNKYGEHNG